MKDPEKFLQRIFSAAHNAPEPTSPVEPPFGMETAVLANWRSSFRPQTGNGGLLRRLRWAAVVACTIALSTAALSREELAEMSHLFAAETHIGDSAVLAGYGND